MWAATGEPLAVPAALATGVLVDADHAIDFYRWYVKRDLRYLWLPLHGWELSIAALVIVAVLGWHPIAVAAVLGHLGHLTADQLANPVRPFTYLIGYRAALGFSRARLLSPVPLPPFAQVLSLNVPMWWLFGPVATKLLPALFGEAGEGPEQSGEEMAEAD